MAENLVEIKYNKAQLQHLEAMLRGFKINLKQVMPQAINRTAITARKNIAGEINKDINLKIGKIKERIIKTKATRDLWVSEIGLSKSAIPIMQFGANQPKKGKGVTFKVYRKGGRKFIDNAFIATMKSGHEAVFRRGIGKGGRIVLKIRGTRKAGKKGITQHNIYIGEQWGPSLHQAFKTNPGLIGRIMAQIGEVLDKNVYHQVKYLLGKKKGRSS